MITTIQPPNKYDLAFLEWAKSNCWRLFEPHYHGKPVVWVIGDGSCPFEVTSGMLERLTEAGFLERKHADDSMDVFYGPTK